MTYDPYAAHILSILTFPSITHNPTVHIGGVAVDPYTGLVTILVDAASAFNTFGADISGDNLLLKYDPVRRAVLWTTNLTAVSQGRYGGFQDVEHDRRGNTYVVGTFPGTILRADEKGAAEPWFLPPEPIDHTKIGYGGLAAVEGTDILLANDNADGQIYRFDMKADRGVPKLVPRTGINATIEFSDAIYLPPRYGGTVLLVAEDAFGVSVLRSKDAKWKTAEYLGRVSNAGLAAQGASVTAPIEVGGSLYMLEEFFADTPVAGSSAGNRTAFPLVDITSQVEALLKA